jgi:aspartate/methionine/tyrosine aminotransferase
MDTADFLCEQWMTRYERKAVFNMTDTSTEAVPLAQLLSYEPHILDDLMLDYGWIEGDPLLRKQILSLYQNQKEETLAICNGALEGNLFAMQAVLEPEDHVITFTPGYQQFFEVPKMLGCTVSEIEYIQPDWHIDTDALEKAVTDKTKLLVFANPANPSGTYLDKEGWKPVIEFAKKHDLWIICDEVYALPDADHPSVSDLYEKAIATCSLSKQYGLAGLRLGWIKGNPEMILRIVKARDYSIISAGPVNERLAAAAMLHLEEIGKERSQTLEKNKEKAKKWLAQSKYFSAVLPEAGTVCLLQYKDIPVECEEFALLLLKEKGIFFVPGSCFGLENCFRLGLGKKHENLEEIFVILEQTAKTLAEAGTESK